MKQSHGDTGFTFVELMVVVLIIGVLVAVAIPVFNSASDSARRRACSANLRTLDGAVEQWVAVSTANHSDALDNVADAQAAIGSYVKDWTRANTCPSAGTVSVSDGNFACSIVDHNYE